MAQNSESEEVKKLKKFSRINVKLLGDVHQCKICSRTYYRRVNLKNHMKTHEKIYSYKCNQCDKGLSSKEGLEAHLKSHMEKKYQCPHCVMLFRLKKSLDKHVMIHPAEKPYRCYQCDRSFSQKYRLERHPNCRKKPHKCYLCDKAFAIEVNLYKHLSKHTQEEYYKCHQCKNTYLHKSHLSVHMLKHSGEKMMRIGTIQDLHRYMSHRLKKDYHAYFEHPILADGILKLAPYIKEEQP